jgi:hypothetical protein
MLRRIGVLALAIEVVVSPACAADRQITITDQEFNAWSQVPALMDRCIGAAVLTRDFGNCQMLAPFLSAFAEKVGNARAAQPAPAPAPAPIPAPAAAPPAASPPAQ